MLSRILNGIAALMLFSVSIFLVVVSAYLVSTEVMPAIDDGTLTVSSDTRVLNILWEGNEIYVLLSGYALLAAGFAYVGILALRKSTRKDKCLLPSAG